MMQPNTAIVLAGGLGTRLRSVVSDVPKPMAPVQELPFLAYQLDYWISQGISRFILSVGYKHEAISSYFQSNYHGAQIDYAVEPAPMGTGGGLLLALEQYPQDKPYLVMNGDTYFGVSLSELTAFAQAHQAEWTVSLFSTHDTTRYMGIQVDRQTKHITDLYVNASTSSTCLANGGVYYLTPNVLAGLTLPTGCKLSVEDDILPTVKSATKRLLGFVCKAPFIDIGLPADYQRAQQLLPTLRENQFQTQIYTD